MAKMEFSGFAFQEQIEELAGSFHREVTEKVLWAGAKVLIKEMKKAIVDNGHVVSRDMENSVDMTPIYSGIDQSYVEVYTQGTDSRGVSNEMKNKYINYGRPRGGQKKDPYLRKLRDRISPRLNSVMSYQMELTLREKGILK